MLIRERRILQESQEQMFASKLPPNPEKRIKTSLHQILNSLARNPFKFYNINDSWFKNMKKKGVGSVLKVTMMGEVMIARRISVYKDPEFLELIKLVRGSDVAFVNLEGLPGNFKGYTYANFDGTPTSFRSFIAEELKWAGFNLISIANNHTMDCGPENMFSAMEALDKAGLTYAGAGKDLDWARMPGYLETEKGLVALIASVTGEQGVTYYQQHTRASKPGNGYIGRPGVNGIRHDTFYSVDLGTFEELKRLKNKFTEYMGKEEILEIQRIPREDDEKELLFLGNRFVLDDKIGIHWLVHKSDIRTNIKLVSDAYKRADWVFMSNHSHESIPYSEVGALPPEHIVKYAHDCINAGADAYLGHGDHSGQGIEIYKDKPIFYSLATPIYSTKSLRRIPPQGYEMYGLSSEAMPMEYFEAYDNYISRLGHTYSNWLQTLLAVFTLEGEKGSRKLTELKLYPIDAGADKLRSQFGVRPLLVKEEGLARKIVGRYCELSAPFGTQIEFKDGIGVVKL